MAYRFDGDLEFLANSSDEELDTLFNILTKDKDGKTRISEEILSDTRYKRYNPKHSQYWELLAEELQLFGASSLVSKFRNKGVLYKEILSDVCDKLKVNYNKKSSTETMEIIYY